MHFVVLDHMQTFQLLAHVWHMHIAQLLRTKPTDARLVLSFVCPRRNDRATGERREADLISGRQIVECKLHHCLEIALGCGCTQPMQYAALVKHGTLGHNGGGVVVIL